MSPLYLPTSPYISPTSPRHLPISRAAQERQRATGAPPPHCLQLIRNCSAALLPSTSVELETLFGLVVMPTYAMTESSPRPLPTVQAPPPAISPAPSPPALRPPSPPLPPHRSPLTAPPSSPGMPIASNPRGEGRKLRSVGYSGGPQARLYVPLTDAAGDEVGFRPCVGDEEGEV